MLLRYSCLKLVLADLIGCDRQSRVERDVIRVVAQNQVWVVGGVLVASYTFGSIQQLFHDFTVGFRMDSIRSPRAPVFLGP